MKILAIETSCDETAISLLDCSGELDAPRFKVLSDALISQIDIHEQYGGVYPMMAKREHQKNLPILLEKVLKEAGEKRDKPEIDYIAVTEGPGLEPALWTGILFALELSNKWNIPLIPINHMEGHMYSILFQSENSKLLFPALALLVSGGHTELVLINNFGSYEIIGRTRDDAVGEAFDKVARMLGLGYPGGPKISTLAEAHRESGLKSEIVFPMPMIHSNNFDFSFSGLKTSVLYKLKELELNEDYKKEVARAFEDSAVGVLIEKTKKALTKYYPKTLIVAGGVSMNKHLRSELEKLAVEFSDTIIRIPEPSLTTDNAIMIGMAAYIKLKAGFRQGGEKLIARGNLSL